MISETLVEFGKFAGLCQFFFSAILGDMKNIHKKGGDASRGLQGWQLKTFVVLPLATRINQHAIASLRLNRRIFRKLKEVEESIEIVAREIARQSKRGE